MHLMGYREYSRHRQCSLKAVQNAIADGRISVVPDAAGRSKIDATAADLAWTRNTDPAKQSVMYSAGPPQPAAQTPARVVPPAAAAPGSTDPDDPEDLPGDTGSSEYRQARTSREQIRAKKEQMEFDALQGRLVSVEDAGRAVFTAFRVLRDNILNVAARVKHQLAAESDAERCEQLLEAELGAALASFDEKAALKERDVDEDEEDAAPVPI